MILAFSTSCAWASVALLDTNGHILLGSEKEHAPQNAGAACLRLLERLRTTSDFQMSEVQMFVADMGPGSFTGVRVGVTLAKTFGFLHSKPVAGISAFDLIAPDRTVVLPSKRGEFFIRRVGQPAVRSVDLPEEDFLGFGPGIEPEVFPESARVCGQVPSLVPKDAALFVPEYLIEPSISTPKKPYRAANA